MSLDGAGANLSLPLYCMNCNDSTNIDVAIGAKMAKTFAHIPYVITFTFIEVQYRSTSTCNKAMRYTN